MPHGALVSSQIKAIYGTEVVLAIATYTERTNIA
jgi:hypothetical protein